MNLEVIFYGLIISVILYVARYIFLLLFRINDPASLLYIAPRGLITILLFFQIGSKHPELQSNKFDSAILLVVIFVTSIVMTFSLIKQGSGLEPIEVQEGQPLLKNEGESRSREDSSSPGDSEN